MVNANKNVTKACSFYASDCHLVTMLLPHINRLINDGQKIVTILEKDMQNQVEFILTKLRLKNEMKILDINWNKTEISTESIEEKLTKARRKELNIIVGGSISYIEEVNKKIEEYISKGETERKIKVIDCYYIEDNLDIKKILNEHDSVLNTAGEKSIEEFKGKITVI